VAEPEAARAVSTPHRSLGRTPRWRGVGRTWLSIQVDLVEGHGEHYWPRPGRLFAAARSHSFAQLANAIDDAFARWDRAHLHEFTLADGTRIGSEHAEWEDDRVLSERRTRLSRLKLSEQFVYVFDLGDDWTHLCTVGEVRIDPEEALGIVPDAPLPFFGWGVIPDQYLRNWNGDDGESDPPPDPQLTDLPPLRPWWGSPRQVGQPVRGRGRLTSDLVIEDRR
jgi:hypothetical protein